MLSFSDELIVTEIIGEPYQDGGYFHLDIKVKTVNRKCSKPKKRKLTSQNYEQLKNIKIGYTYHGY